MKYLTVLMFILTFVYFVPTAYFISKAYEKVEIKMTKRDDNIGIFSFGAFVKFSDPSDPDSYVNLVDRQSYIDTVTGLVMASILVTFIASVYMRKKLLDQAVELDKIANTPSDFALIGYCPRFSDNCNYTR